MFFLKFLKWRGSGVLAIEEFWKFSLKMGGSSMKWGGVGGQICFLALSVILEFHFCVCLYDVP